MKTIRVKGIYHNISYSYKLETLVARSHDITRIFLRI
jgi:hypothetical protein